MPLPITNPPPWMCTIIGRLVDPSAGAHTLTNRQSSVPPEPNPGKLWAHSLPNEVACSVVVQGVGGCGGYQRRDPTGGAA